MSIILGLNNQIESATLTAVDVVAATPTVFETTLPLTHLQNYILPKVARTTTDAALTLTATFSPAITAGVVMLANHNIGRLGKVRIKAYLSSIEVDDSGDLYVWPYSGGAIVNAALIATMRPDYAYFLPANTSVDAVKITITDTSNADTYIQIGRLFVGETFDAEKGVEYGDAGVAYKSMSEIQTVPRGIKYPYKQSPLRVATVNYTALTDDEAINTIFDAQRQTELIGEVVYSYKGRPTYSTISSTYAQSREFFARCFLGNFSELNPITAAFYNAHGTLLSIEEVAR